MKVAVVTGANRGVGYGIAYALHEQGYKVVALNRTFCGETWLTEKKCDLTSKEDIDHAIDEIAQAYGRIDILVNNAGVRRFFNIRDISDRDWEESLTTNLTAPLRLVRKTARWLAESKGLIVFVGSHAAEYPFENGVAYSCSKAALHQMAEIAIHDLRHEGIRVCCLSLGAIANRPYEGDEWKMRPSDIGQLVVSLTELPHRVMPAYIEMRPSMPNPLVVSGLERLQYI